MSATGGILPTYQRFVNGPGRRSFRSKEKAIIFLVFATFCLVCFGTFFYLPEFKGSGSRVYDQIKRAGPDLLIPPPPQLEDTREAQRFIRHEEDAKEDPHIFGDREKLKAKIEEDHELKVLERPDQAIIVPKRTSTGDPPLNAPDSLNQPINQIDEILAPEAITVPPAPAQNYPMRQGGEDREESVRKKRDKVKEVALILGVSGACRTDELIKMKTTHIDVLENKISIEIPDTKTYKSRSFIINDTNWVKIVKEFIQLRKDIKNERFFVQYRLGKARNQPFGYNSLSKFPYKIACFLKLPKSETYTGHAFRRTAATLLVNSGADILQLKRLGGWKSSTVAEGYVDASEANQTKTANMISSTSLPSSSCIKSNFSPSVNSREPENGQEITFSSSNTSMSETHHQGGLLEISVKAYNQSNVTINFSK